MAAVKGKNTHPELLVRRIVHRLGYRFRLHVRDLPGVPDLVFPRLKRVIFVHGCFWHLHSCRHGQIAPRSNAAFWRKKREGNRARDQKHLRALRRSGWKALVVWECRLKNRERLSERLLKFLSAS